MTVIIDMTKVAAYVEAKVNGVASDVTMSRLVAAMTDEERAMATNMAEAVKELMAAVEVSAPPPPMRN